MSFIPQEAKDQIASLMSEVEKLENQNKSLKANFTKSKVEGENYKTYSVIFGVVSILLAILLIYTYSFKPLFGELRDKAELGQVYMTKAERLQKENELLDKNIKDLKLQLENKVDSSSKIASSLVYRVQIGAFKKFKMSLYSPSFEGILEKNSDGFNKYSLGVFEKYQDALQFKKELRKMGLRTSFLVAESNGKEISIKEAIKLEKK